MITIQTVKEKKMKKEANYKSMYQEMLFSSEKAIKILENCQGRGNNESAVSAVRTLIAAQLMCEDIYIASTDSKIIRLEPNSLNDKSEINHNATMVSEMR